MISPEYSRDTIRRRLLSGALPRAPGEISDGSSSRDKLCDGCQHPIFAFHKQYEIALPSGAAEQHRLSMHRECYRAWLEFSSTLGGWPG